MTLNIGDKAPDFTLFSDENKTVALKNLRGKKVVIYFYPKDYTPGCTRQACYFRDFFTQFSAHNTEILGISKDSPLCHKKFKEKYHLPFLLLADESGDVCKAYGVMSNNFLFGNTFLGITRSTFLLDETGTIKNIWRKVNVKEHAQQVLHELNKI